MSRFLSMKAKAGAGSGGIEQAVEQCCEAFGQQSQNPDISNKKPTLSIKKETTSQNEQGFLASGPILLISDNKEKTTWSGEIASCLQNGLVVSNGKTSPQPKPDSGDQVRVVVTQDLIPIEARATIVACSKVGVALELTSGWTLFKEEKQTWETTCFPIRYQALTTKKAQAVKGAIKSSLRQPDASWTRSETNEAPSPDALFDRLECSLANLSELILWRGIKGKPLCERELILSKKGVSFELEPHENINPGECIELELLLPMGFRDFRIRAVAQFERKAPEKSAHSIVLRFKALDLASEEAIEHYLSKLRLKRTKPLGQEEKEKKSCDSNVEQIEASDIVFEKQLDSEPSPQKEQLTSLLQISNSLRRPRLDGPRVEGQWQPKQELSPEKFCEEDYDELLAEVFDEMQGLYDIQTPEECMSFALDLAMRKIRCMGAVVFRASGSAPKEKAQCVVSHGLKLGSLQGRGFDIRGSLIETALTEGVPVSVSDADRDRRLFADVDCLFGADTKSYLCAPIAYEGRYFGVISLLNRCREGAWAQGEINIISYITGRLGEYIAQCLDCSDDSLSEPALDFDSSGSKVPDYVEPQRKSIFGES